jgi:L-lactate dehydrogenase complex protein LldF
VRINIPQMLIGLRELQHHHGKGRWEGLAYRLWSALLRRPWLYRLAVRFARVLRTLNKDGWLSKLPGPGAAWTSCRDFPAPAAQSFRDRWKEL